ncbi:18302_t:CDS:2 [Entrophospora sp. SA101]|nr:11310_t:CDS:2 [Entrophospora sp. SA101]CAJ0650036.1 4904_t:CDS:2 [Entrophospora sp. SA101]CAJ0755738.1 18302_t:CDS:2 [Entrophospora sp. SA101]CAJ0830372.1 1189_t:CDS:2 [Entrophospora sp. SA101]CAJ0862978.1 3862_t:CDS:2 [Entrophospora sp. SA101]
MSGRNNSYNDQYTYDSKLYASVTPATDNSLQQPIHQSHQYQHYNNNIDSKYTNYPTSTNKTYQQNSYNYSSPPSFNNYYYHQPPTGPASTSKMSIAPKTTVEALPSVTVRAAGGEVWEDSTLLEWDSNDFRLFCGDLGNEVTDDMLYKAFSKYLSIQKTKVIRDKRTGKSKGYGFVSFKDADEFVKAWKEMNGKYVGNRPIKLRKSNWKDRNFDAKSKKHHPY